MFYHEKYVHEQTRGLYTNDLEDESLLFETDTNLYKMQCVAKLPAGTVLGEKGLDENVPRSATCICSEDCHFGVILKDDYIKVLKEVSRLQAEKNKMFILENVFKNMISETLAAKLAFDFFKFKQHTRRNSYIFK